MSPVSTVSVRPSRGRPSIFGSADAVVADAVSDATPAPWAFTAETR